MMSHLAQQSCNVELPRDLGNLFLQVLTLPFNSFNSCFEAGRRDWEKRPSHTGLALLELLIREVR